MDDFTLFSQLLELGHLLDRIRYAQHGSTAVNRSNLSTAISTLSSVLAEITKLLETADNTVQRHHAAESLSEIVDRSIPILESHLEIFERDCSNSKRGRSRNSWVYHYQHSREERRICRSIDRITTNISLIPPLLDGRSTNSPPATGPIYDNHERATRRDPTPPRGRRRDRGDHGRRVQFQDDPSVSELAGCHSFRAELPAPLKADEEPMVIPANVRAGRFITTSDDDRAISFDDDIYTDTEGVVSGLDSPQHSPQTSPPPPPYASLRDPLTSNGVGYSDVHADNYERDFDSPSVTAQSSESGESWVNPIIAGLRKVVNLNFPTACAGTTCDYTRYRKQMLSSPNYKWFLNFRYMSFVLQPDLPFQVFLTNLKTYASEPRYGPCKVLAYLFEDCIIFAVNPFCPMLPDPNVPLTDGGEDDRSTILDNGLEVLEDWPIRFEDLTSVRRDSTHTLIVEITHIVDDDVSDISLDETEISNERIRHVLVFETTRQREEVFEALSPWLMRNDHDDRSSWSDARSEPHNNFGTSESFVSSSSSSFSRSSSIARTRNLSESPERLTRQSPSRSKIQERDRTANYTYHSRSHAGPSYEPHNRTSATIPRSMASSHVTHVPHPDYRSERKITFGISRYCSPPSTKFWVTKTKKKHWYWREQRRSDPVAGGRETEK